MEAKMRKEFFFESREFYFIINQLILFIFITQKSIQILQPKK